MKEKKRMPIIFWVIFAVFLTAFIGLVNFTQDPGLLFATPSTTELKALEIMDSGLNVGNIGNYNERMVKRLLCLERGKTDVIALGSSRAAPVTNWMVGNESFINLSIAGAMMEETIGLYGLYYENYGAPERVVFVVDPWFFCYDFNSERFNNSLGDGYYYYCTEVLGYELDESDYVIDEFYEDPESYSFFDLSLKIKAQIFSITYFQSAFRKMLSNTGTDFVPTDDEFGVYAVLRKDGSYAYPESYRKEEESTILARSVGSGILGEGRYDVGNGERTNLFEKFVESMIADGVDVDLLLVPINPEIYERTLAEGIPLVEVEEYLLNYAKEKGIEAEGSYVAANLEASLIDFYDAYHFRHDRLARVVARFGGES